MLRRDIFVMMLRRDIFVIMLRRDIFVMMLRWDTFVTMLSGRYGFMLFMPISGITMGYFGGKGLPFYGSPYRP